MADTVPITAGTGTTIGTDEVSIGGTLQHVQRVKLVDGADGGTGLIGGDATNGLDVDVTRLPALVAGTANIGDVDVATGPLPHANGTTMASATAQYTTTQTSTILGPTNAAGIKMYVTSIQIQAGGTVAGSVQVYFGTAAYSRGTSRAIFDGEFAPSATLKPGYAQSPFVPFESVAGDEVRVTTSAAINPLTVTIWYYLV